MLEKGFARLRGTVPKKRETHLRSSRSALQKPKRSAACRTSVAPGGHYIEAQTGGFFFGHAPDVSSDRDPPNNVCLDRPPPARTPLPTSLQKSQRLRLQILHAVPLRSACSVPGTRKVDGSWCQHCWCNATGCSSVPQWQARYHVQSSKH